MQSPYFLRNSDSDSGVRNFDSDSGPKKPGVSESKFLTAHQHILGHSVPENGVKDVTKE